MRGFRSSDAIWLRKRARGLAGLRLRRFVDDSDLAQDALVERLRSGEVPVVHPRAYLACILRRIAGRKNRDACKHAETIPIDHVAAASTGPGSRAGRREDVHRALLALSTLPQPQQQVVRLRILQGLSFSECAEQLRCSEPHARVTFHRALAKLRTRFDA